MNNFVHSRQQNIIQKISDERLCAIHAVHARIWPRRRRSRMNI